jgi:hypothetical protein
VRTRPFKNTAAAAAAYDVLYGPQVRPAGRGSHECGKPARGATVARAVDGQPHPDQTVGGSVRGGTRAIQPQRARHAVADSLQSADLVLPRTAPPAGLVNTLPLLMLEEEAGHQPKQRVGPRLNPLPTTTRMMNILEAEGGREVAAQLASPPAPTRLVVILLGGCRRGTAAGLHDENP